MSAFWSMFWFKPFQNFLRKITIFRYFNQWSEILSMSDGRPLSQGVCPSLSAPSTSVLDDKKKWGGNYCYYPSIKVAGTSSHISLRSSPLSPFPFLVSYLSISISQLSFLITSPSDPFISISSSMSSRLSLLFSPISSLFSYPSYLFYIFFADFFSPFSSLFPHLFPFLSSSYLFHIFFAAFFSPFSSLFPVKILSSHIFFHPLPSLSFFPSLYFIYFPFSAF
jgi:hypothetical protein